MPIQQESGGKVPQNSNILKMSESLQSINRQMIKYKNQPYHNSHIGPTPICPNLEKAATTKMATGVNRPQQVLCVAESVNKSNSSSIH